MTQDYAAVVTVVSFALLLTLHVTMVFTLAGRHPRWHAALALAVPMLAPYFAFRAGARVRATLFVALAVAYGASLIVATR